MENRVPPFYSHPFPFQSQIETGSFHRFELAGYFNSDLYLSDRMALQAGLNRAFSNRTTDYSVQETIEAWWLIRSKLWRAFLTQAQRICVLTEYELPHIHILEANPFEFLTFEEQIAEAKKLTFQQKCNETLKNIYLFYMQNGKHFHCPYIYLNAPSLFTQRKIVTYWSPRDAVENGAVYACNENDAILVYKHLLDEELIEQSIESMKVLFALTAKGRMETERLNRLKGSKRMATSLEQKKQDRLRFLHHLYEVTDGNVNADVNMFEFGQELGLSREDTSSITNYLMGESSR